MALDANHANGLVEVKRRRKSSGRAGPRPKLHRYGQSEGFVTREGGDDLDVRNIAGITTTLIKKDIKERGQRETSMMPAGLLDKLTVRELASLLAYLESLKGK